jgi:glutamate N-acetyltransferase / amino-acid N-acetyltransferase
VIGKQLPIERIEAGIQGMAGELQADPLLGAEGIMTTDTYPKALSVSVGPATICLVGKGSGMIAPDMATMLVYIFTDAAIGATALHRLLCDAAEISFNMLSVDGDTSTSDTCVLLANGLAGEVEEALFRDELTAACIRMTELLARDGEGATKLLRVRVAGAVDAGEARQVARSVVESPLVKTMAYGADPNVGRILMAVGKCTECSIAPELVRVAIGGTEVYGDGARSDFDEEALRRALGGDTVDIAIELGVGEEEATAYGCDLTEGYIRENAAYYSS